ncbi:MAG: SDR family oxidoreductase [Bacteroidota bacterium]
MVAVDQLELESGVGVSPKQTALILGGSRGLGLATAMKLSKHDHDIVIVHRDPRSLLTTFQASIATMEANGSRVKTYNLDASKQHNIDQITDDLLKDNCNISCLVHSISRGNVKPLVADQNRLTDEDLNQTIQVMGVSLHSWVHAIADRGLFTSRGRVIAFTSAGGRRPYPGYAGVSAAKAVLEALVRSIALEYSAIGLRVNAVQAGITDTRSLRAIPGSEDMLLYAEERALYGRITRPEDVADAVYLLTRPEADWITGTIITADGGEHLL